MVILKPRDQQTFTVFYDLASAMYGNPQYIALATHKMVSAYNEGRGVTNRFEAAFRADNINFTDAMNAVTDKHPELTDKMFNALANIKKVYEQRLAEFDA